MKDDYLSADWAAHHHILTDGMYGLLSLLSFGLLKPNRSAALPAHPQKDDD